ncbi:MAG: alpha-amylase family protein [Ardenticatenaceae bacterium]|nr:alpha-amylase family protein [Ardenticatenaceae bacterium]
MNTPKSNPRLTRLEISIFEQRCQLYLPDAHEALRQIYGEREDFDQWVDEFRQIAFQAYARRPAPLRALDLQRLHEPDWYQRSDQVGYICYVDRFCGTLKKLPEKIPYLRELGVTYLHLMPLLQPGPDPNDGGYAVMNYREVDPRLGTMRDLAQVAKKLREEGISLCIDLVCNHTADMHEWAVKAKEGDPTYQDYYLTFPDRTLTDQYDQTLREIFPETAPGNFLYIEEMKQWVWNTFNRYQWDLNYANPAVFGEMLEIILYLANNGVEVLRLDAVAFMWKKMGTSCENLPEAHAILQAFRAFSKLAAPGLVFKAEAIVAPQDVVPYLGTGRFTNKECELAYHNSLMVYMWSMLAERNVVLSTYSLQELPEIPSIASWVTYVRCHDDIGWAIMDEYAAAVGLNGFWHRSFLSDFYSGDFEGSFARGTVFQFNPETMDRRISGACASLAGLETALEGGDPYEIELAIRRILLIHNLVFAAGGIPLIYMGDEIGLLNDYSYTEDAAKKGDSRWMHRPLMDWDLAQQRFSSHQPAGRIFQGLRHLAQARKNTPALHSQAASKAVWTHNDHVFGLLRYSPRGRILLLGNFSEEPQQVPSYRLEELGFQGELIDHLTGQIKSTHFELLLQPFEALWLEGQ